MSDLLISARASFVEVWNGIAVQHPRYSFTAGLISAVPRAFNRLQMRTHSLPMGSPEFSQGKSALFATALIKSHAVRPAVTRSTL